MVTNVQNARPVGSVVWLFRLATVTIVLTALAVVVGVVRSWWNTRMLAEHRAAWAVEESAYEGLVSVQGRFYGSEAACGELAGSWETGESMGWVIRRLLGQAQAGIEIGKVELICEYGYDGMNSDDGLCDLPTRERTLLIAARCYEAIAEQEILAFQDRIRSAAAELSLAPAVRLEGLERVESAHDPRGSEHMVFAIRLVFPPEHLMVVEGGG